MREGIVIVAGCQSGRSPGELNVGEDRAGTHRERDGLGGTGYGLDSFGVSLCRGDDRVNRLGPGDPERLTGLFGEP
ncbi:MAG TPA: hypothetical protein VGH56_10520, partial [Solirubrobacteraceae bacterium]